MCVYSMIMDHYDNVWGRRISTDPFVKPYEVPNQFVQPVANSLFTPVVAPLVTSQEIQEFKELLARAREYDAKNHEPECELESKKLKLRELAKELGVEIDFP